MHLKNICICFAKNMVDFIIKRQVNQYKYLLNNLPFLDDERNRINSLCNVKIDTCRQLWSRNNYVTPQLSSTSGD